MKIDLIEISGVKTALTGLYLPFNVDTISTVYDVLKVENTSITNKQLDLLRKLIYRGDDHSKVLRMINLSFTISAPRYWWQEFDTYRIGVEKISSSTMHTLIKILEKLWNSYTDKTYEEKIWQLAVDLTEYKYFHSSTDAKIIEAFCKVFAEQYESYKAKSKEYKNRSMFLNILKANLPEGYIQTRVVNISLQTLHRMVEQRKKHRLKEWKIFVSYITEIELYKLLYE